MSPATATFGPLRFTGLTSLGLVLEALVGEKHLFAACEHELRTALRTLQHLVVVFHEPLSPGPVPGRRLGGLCTREPKCLRKPVSGDAGRGSLGPAGTKPKRDPKNYPALRGPDSRKCGAEPSGKRIGGPNCFGAASLNLIRFPPLLLAQSLPRKRFFRPALLAGFHVEAVLLDFLDDVLLLHLALETPQGIFQGFTLLDDDFSHFINSPPIRFGLVSCGTSRRPCCGRLETSAGAAPALIIACIGRFEVAPGLVAGHLLINSRHPSQGFFDSPAR